MLENKDVEKDEGMKNLTRNAGILLEKLIGFSIGRGHSISRSCSLNSHNSATDNFNLNQVILDVGAFVLYKGFLQDRPVIVKKYKDDDILEENMALRVVYWYSSSMAIQYFHLRMKTQLTEKIPQTASSSLLSLGLQGPKFPQTGNLSSCFRGNVDVEKDERNLIRNGGIILEKLIGFTNGRGHSVVRSFSLHDLNIATHYFDQNRVILLEGFYKLYKGFLQDRPVIMKKYNDDFSEECISDIVFSSQMKVHNNVLSLLGCCLQSSIPILVSEYAEKLSLDEYIFNREYRADFQPLSWKNRLKIAVDVANVIAYLHTAFSRPVVHRGIKTKTILLDEDYGAKVSDFSFSISMPEGETHINDVVSGTSEYIAPEYSKSGCMFNEKIDVYSFGMVLLVLLTRRNPFKSFPAAGVETFDFSSGIKSLMENDRFEEVIDPTIAVEGLWSAKEQQLKAFTMLALRCPNEDPEDRPEITNVGIQLREMYQSLISISVHQP